MLPLEDHAMPHARKPNPIVDLAEARLAQNMAEMQALLAPELSDAVSAEALSRHVAAQLAALPAEDGGLLRRKLAVTVHDLETLVASLQQELTGLGQELRTVTCHSGAATAYGTAGRRPTPHRG